jgi:methylenetetrahydrofolate dehydrogenase (NADP+)/methenyltetrahydrofolate cyclohydrolase
VTEARLLFGEPVAGEVRARVRRGVTAFARRHGFRPALAALMVGQQRSAGVYVRQILRTCERVGVPTQVVELPASSSAADLAAQIRRLNADRAVAGIIVQMPLPRHIPLTSVTDNIDPAKDIDGIHPLNAGLMTLGFEGFLPACAEAAVRILTQSGYQLEGRRAVVIGRSNVVGKPIELLLLRANCTVTVCHRRTRDLATEIGRAEVLVSAAGHAGLVSADMLKPGALVVDVGINVTPTGIVGDVDFGPASEVALAITPVPGGVGPLTNAILLEHLLRAARWQASGHPITAGRGRRRSAA